ncbi:MAG: hypothetical protein IPH75_07570 [bacterium]|nr:hypothetical protein [bacterium]
MTRFRRDSISSRSWYPALLGLIIGAITLWPMSYSTLNNSTSGIALGWAIFCAIAGLYLGATTDRPYARLALAVCGGVAIAQVIRIIVDCTFDPTNHNLWPFEFVWMMICCFPATFIGAWVGRRLLQRD